MFTFAPLPHTEAVSRIEELPVVTREIMRGLVPELQAHAFTVAGLQGAEEMVRVKKILATVPAGANWTEAKKQVVAELTAGGLDPKTVQRRAETLLRTTAFRAYAATRYRVLMAQRDIFPFWQYKTAGDGNVRPAHTALHNQVFPAGHDIWQRIFPPWGWGCRCLVVPLTKRAAERMGAASEERRAKGEESLPAEGGLLKGQRQAPVIYTPNEADLIARSARLPGGISLEVDPTWGRSPWSEKGNLRPSWEYLESLYKDDPEAFAAFRDWSEKTEVRKGLTVSAWVDGKSALPPAAKSVTKVATQAAKKATRAVTTATASTSVDEALAMFGIDRTKPITETQAAALIEELKESTPANGRAKIAAIKGVPRKHPAITKALIQRTVDEFAEFLPPSVVSRLPQFTIHVSRTNAWSGAYMPSWDVRATGGPVLNLSSRNLVTPEGLRHTLFHELAHWLHLESPDNDAWVNEIKDHFNLRTAGEAVVNLGGNLGTGKRDKWFDAYMGRIYGSIPSTSADHSGGAHLGMEFPTRCLELLAPQAPTLKNPNPPSIPAKWAEVWNSSQEARDDLTLALKGLYP
jgi:SPP1 gp7 family putative phage head morphogenesis protein